MPSEAQIERALQDIMEMSELLFDNGYHIEHVPSDKMDMTLRIATVVFLDLIFRNLKQIKNLLEGS